MAFKELKTKVQQQFAEMSKNGAPLFKIEFDYQKLWEVYLGAFKPEDNPIYQVRTEHDCSCCRHFLRDMAGIVALKDNKFVTLWDFEIEGVYEGPVTALRNFVNNCVIADVFMTPFTNIGQVKSIDWDNDFEHFGVAVPSNYQKLSRDIPTYLGDFRTGYLTLKRASTEFKMDALEMVYDLIMSNNLYRGAEKKNMVKAFIDHKNEYDKLSGKEAENFLWATLASSGPAATLRYFNNDVIGTLVRDLSEGEDLEVAVAKYENKVSGTNYQRPTALITPKMREAAKETITQLGLQNSLERRFATAADVPVQEVLFKSTAVFKEKDIFDDIPVKNTAKLKGLAEVSINDFISNVVPTAKSIQVLFGYQYQSNLVSLITASDPTAPNLFKWPNSFSWSYAGDFADAVKERVKNAGGNVEGELRFSLSWNTDWDLDLHLSGPSGCHIYYGNKVQYGGKLDVDANAGYVVPNPCENIVFTDIKSLPDGTYKLYVNTYSKRRDADTGFIIQTEFRGAVENFEIGKAPIHTKNIVIAEIVKLKNNVTINPMFKGTTSSNPGVPIWNVTTNDFCDVEIFCKSPNFWGDSAVGNLHYFFFLKGCKTDQPARGFFNEFLRDDLNQHRKTMEIVGTKLKTEEADQQLSGLGFSSTGKNELVVRVHSSFAKDYKVII